MNLSSRGDDIISPYQMKIISKFNPRHKIWCFLNLNVFLLFPGLENVNLNVLNVTFKVFKRQSYLAPLQFSYLALAHFDYF